MADENIDIRVRLQNGRVVATEARAVAAGVDSIGDAAQRSGRHLGAFQRMGERVQPVLTGIGRATKTAGFYVSGFAGIMAAFGTATGINFNATMEQNTVAFTQFLGSTRKARAYLGQLYSLAAKTPFEFPDLVSGARRFLAFGFAAKQSKQILKEIGDTAAGLGGGAEEIDRMVMAIGQMKAKGRIQTEELLQLAELGVPVFDYLSKGLKLSGEELQSELQKGAVGFKEGLNAIRSGMREDFGGMSGKQAKTFNGQLSTLKDNTVQMLGNLTRPLFNKLRDDLLPGLNKALPGIQAWIKGAVGKLPGVFDAIKGGVGDFIDAIKPAQPLWENVLWPLLKGFGMGLGASVIGALKVAVPVFKGFMVVLGAVGDLLAPLKGAFTVLGGVLGFVFGGPILKALSASKKLGEGLNLVKGAFWVLSAPVRLVGKAFLFVGGTLFKLWMKFSPVGILLRKLPGALRTAGGAFKSFASTAWGAISGGFNKVLGLVSGLGGKFFSAGVGLVSKLVAGLKGIGSKIVEAFGSGIGFAGDIGSALANWLNESTPLGDHISLPGPLPDFDMPALANGGIITSAGSVLVGERGPEVLNLGRGASVNPLPRFAAETTSDGGGGGFSERLIVIQLDGKEVGRRVERWGKDKANRR